MDNHPRKLPLSFIKSTIKTLKPYGFRLNSIYHLWKGMSKYHLVVFDNEQLPGTKARIFLDRENGIRFHFIPKDCFFLDGYHFPLSLDKAQEAIAAFIITHLDP